MNKTVPDMLMEAAKLYRQKNIMYGSSYKKTGELLKKLFPDGMTLKTASDYNRFSILTLIVGKIARYINCWEGGNDEDTMTDLAVYAIMLQELDNERPKNDSISGY
jgi:hypothetical protein